MEAHIQPTIKALEIDTEILERVERYAKAHRLDVDALIAAAITLTVPMDVGGTATPDVLELEARAKHLVIRRTKGERE